MMIFYIQIVYKGQIMEKSFILVGTYKEDQGTQTIESYNTAEEVLYAFFYVTTNKEHLYQNGSGETMDVSEFEEFFIDVEIYENGNFIKFDDLENHIDYLL